MRSRRAGLEVGYLDCIVVSTCIKRLPDPAAYSRASLSLMWLARRVLIVALTVTLTTYALDCVGMTSPEQAMQCCNSMRCPSHHHRGQDCCKTMPATHAAFDQPRSIQHASVSPVTLGLAVLPNEPRIIEASERMIAEHSHAPPIFCSLPILSLRI